MRLICFAVSTIKSGPRFSVFHVHPANEPISSLRATSDLYKHFANFVVWAPRPVDPYKDGQQIPPQIQIQAVKIDKPDEWRAIV
jgi:hypothetical protein